MKTSEQEKSSGLGGQTERLKGGLRHSESATPISHINILDASRIEAEKLLGEIQWKDSDSGFCRCPGYDLHSTKNGKRDCAVFITPGRAPTIHCQHNSCSGAVEESNRKLRSSIGKLQADPAHRPTPEEVKKWQREAREKRLQRAREQRIREAWSNQLEAIHARYPWTLEEVVSESPVNIFNLRKSGRPEWAHLVEAIFKPDDIIFIGALEDKGAGHFKPAGEWLEIFGQANGPRLAEDKVLISSCVWRPGCFSRHHQNIIGRRALVLESDTLGENVFPVFRWLRQVMKLRAVVYSGGKSFHAWFQPPPDDLREELESIADSIGLDKSMFSKSTTRLPGAIRPETGRNQDLIYLERGNA